MEKSGEIISAHRKRLKMWWGDYNRWTKWNHFSTLSISVLATFN